HLPRRERLHLVGCAPQPRARATSHATRHLLVRELVPERCESLPHRPETNSATVSVGKHWQTLALAALRLGRILKRRALTVYRRRWLLLCRRCASRGPCSVCTSCWSGSPSGAWRRSSSRGRSPRAASRKRSS